MEQKFHVGIKALIQNENKEILLLRANPEELRGSTPTHWDLPGGRIHENDSIEQTLVREVKEELGVDGVEIVEYFDTHISNMKIPLDNETVGLMLVVYKCKLPNSEFKLNFEHLEYRWVPIEEAKELLKFKFPESFLQKLDSV